MSTKKNELSWISDEALSAICKELVENTRAHISDKLSFENIVDPFSAMFDLAVNNVTYEKWVGDEITRQNQKTLQNQIGEFHQHVLGKVEGWESVFAPGSRKKRIFLVNRNKRIIAVVKNKFNSDNSNGKKGAYNSLDHALKNGYPNFTAYYVMILVKDKIFAPSDNETGGRPGENQNIREIDGASFYALATGSKTALADLYTHLPNILAGITGADTENIAADPWFKKLFQLAVK